MSTVECLLVLVASMALSIVAVGASIRIAHRFHVMDAPDGGRKSQVRAIPLLGGVAVAVAFTVTTIGALLVLGRPSLVGPALAVLLPALGAAVLGAVDDVRGIGPAIRLLLQSALALAAFQLGTRIELAQAPVLNAILTVGFVVVVVNGINLLDNSDGLAATTVLVSATGATALAALLGQDLVALLGCALVGVSVGFLWHNWFPARVYLGDSGAYLLGFLLAVLVVRVRPEQFDPIVGVAIALLLVALPIADTTFVVLRRLRARVHPFTAGRDHLSHELQARGRSVPVAVLTLQIVPGLAVLGAVALAMETL